MALAGASATAAQSRDLMGRPIKILNAFEYASLGSFRIISPGYPPRWNNYVGERYRSRMYSISAKSASVTADSKNERSLDPIRAFPWDIAVKRFCERVADLTTTCMKWIAIPCLFVSTASEIVYSLLHGKAMYIPVSMIVGIVIAGMMKETAMEVSPNFDEKQFPWHILTIGIVFMMIKLPGPLYPFWGRILLPHFANGGLWQTCYFAFQKQS